MGYCFNDETLKAPLSEETAREAVRQFKECYNEAAVSGESFICRDTFHYMGFISSAAGGDRQIYGLLLPLFKQCSFVSACQYPALSSDQVEPPVMEEGVLELFSVCSGTGQERLITLPVDRILMEREYRLTGAFTDRIINLRGLTAIRENRLYNPLPENIKALFDRVHEQMPGIVFTDKAYSGAQKRESSFRMVGYDQLLKTFVCMNEILLPFYRNTGPGFSEEMVFDQFYLRSGIRVSCESNKTMKIYGHLRNVTIGGETVQMTNHLKFNRDACRIHFYYMNEKIYIGHSGEHLRTAES